MSLPAPTDRWPRRLLLRRMVSGVAGLALALGVGACRNPAPQPGGERTIQFWTLDLAPKFNTYIRDVILSLIHI